MKADMIHLTETHLGKPFPNDTAAALAKLPGIQLNVGRYSYGVPHIQYAPGHPKSRLDIGSFCSIAGDVEIFVGTGGRHPIDFATTFPLSMIFPDHTVRSESSRMNEGDLSVSIGSDVWIGQRAMILNGVKIGHGAVIGAGAVVTKDVKPYEIVGGNPAAHIRYRFSEREIARFLRLAWWDWDDATILKNINLFYTRDIEIVIDGLEAVTRA